MDEIIKQIQQRTGISEEQARGAADTVIGFLKDRLPAPIAGQIDGILGGGGEGGALGGYGDIGKLTGR
ncbi:MAG TPA: hypothetical protein VMP67_04625 [Candidatus Limnocylindria bacterium]|nr:hypothetical protein [Candidatus Limnocylindria bacterium]